MSRLDDELKLAFRRKQPSADFTQQVLARIAAQTKPQKLSLWQRLLGFFQMPTLRWAVAGAAILLIAVIGVIQYQRSNHRDQTGQTLTANQSSPDNTNTSQSAMASDTKANGNTTIKKDEVKPTAPEILPKPEQHKVQQVALHPKRKPSPRKLRTDSDVPEGQVVATNSNPKAMTERARGEQAKEQLFKALAITSSLLSEARSAAFGGK